MGFRFRKSFGRGPFRFTFSKRGVSTSVRVKGVRVTSGPNGDRVTVGAGGLSYSEKLDGPPPIQLSGSRLKGCGVPFLVFSVIVVALIWLARRDMPEGPAARANTPEEIARLRVLSKPPVVVETVPEAPPAEPRYRIEKEYYHPQVYADRSTRIFHRPGCSEYVGGGNMVKAAAQMSGYRQDAACAHLPLEIEERERKVLLPELPPEVATQTTTPSRTLYVPPSPSYSGSSSGDIQVKGYTRKEGTYVKPHTRKRRE